MANYRSFTNRDCEFYPCHKTDRLNCLFCFCPLYFLECGGNCTRTSRGLKDCSECLLPHTENGYDYIVQKLTEVAARCCAAPDTEPIDCGVSDEEPAGCVDSETDTAEPAEAGRAQDSEPDSEPAEAGRAQDFSPDTSQSRKPDGSAE